LTSSLHQQVRRTIRRHALIPAGARVIVGLSGGSDSVALALLLKDLSQHGDFALAGVAHLNHGLRPAAAADEAFCRKFAARHRLATVIEAIDVKAIGDAESLSIEEAARRVRYEFLARAATALTAARIAVGHTQDDQAETFLMKLMRGAGLSGLGGVYPRRGAVIRPLLDVSRTDLRAFLVDRGERWVEDETNDDVANPRNRIRHLVLPELDRALGGPSRPSIARSAALAQEDSDWLDELAEERFMALSRETATGLDLDASGVAILAGPVARRVVLRGLRKVAEGREVSRDHVDAAMAVSAGFSGGVDVPGGRVELRAGKLVLLQQKATRSDTL
jgi:tRNA(Ile)-lysidine synthase